MRLFPILQLPYQIYDFPVVQWFLDQSNQSTNFCHLEAFHALEPPLNIYIYYINFVVNCYSIEWSHHCNWLPVPYIAKHLNLTISPLTSTVLSVVITYYEYHREWVLRYLKYALLVLDNLFS